VSFSYFHGCRAIALFNLQDKKQANSWLMSLAKDKSIDSFQSSFAVIDRYWENTQKIQSTIWIVF